MIRDRVALAKERSRLRARAGGFFFGLPVWATGGGSFDPATLNLTGWWRASYGGSPWAGTASAGASGSRSISQASAPSVGSAVNGFTPADFIPANSDRLEATMTAGFTDYISTTAFTIIVLFYADAQPADAGQTNPYDQCQLFGTDGGNIVMPLVTYSTAGVGAGFWDNNTWDSVRVAAPTGAWTMAKVRFSGGSLGVGLNNGSYSTLARSSVAGSTTTTLRIGVGSTGSGGGAKFFDGRILEIMVANTALSDFSIDSIRTYFNNRYALSL